MQWVCLRFAQHSPAAALAAPLPFFFPPAFLPAGWPPSSRSSGSGGSRMASTFKLSPFEFRMLSYGLRRLPYLHVSHKIVRFHAQNHRQVVEKAQPPSKVRVMH